MMRKGNTREKATRGVWPFLAWVDFHVRSRFAVSTIPEEKWGTTRSLSTNSCLQLETRSLQVLAIAVMHVETLKDVKKGNILRSTVNLFKILMGFH